MLSQLRSIPFLLGLLLVALAPWQEWKAEDQKTFSAEDFARQAGVQAGSLYCNETSFEISVERGIMQAMLNSGIPMTELEEKVDFDSDASQVMIIAMIDYTIDNCPQRAKQIFRDFSSISP